MGLDSMTLAIGQFVVGAASAVASGIGQAQQAKAQEQYVEAQSAEYARVAELNNQAAVKEYVEQSAAERMNQMQEKARASQQLQETQREALQKKGTMLASTNAAGGALNYLLADYERQEAERKDVIREQYEWASANADTNIAAYRDTAQNRINGQQHYISGGSSYSNGMNILGTALGIGSAGFNAYSNYGEATWRRSKGKG